MRLAVGIEEALMSESTFRQRGRTVTQQTPLEKMHGLSMTRVYDPTQPLPAGWALCCPYCETWAMAQTVLPNWIVGWQCTGKDCGKFISKEASEQHRALFVVER